MNQGPIFVTGVSRSGKSLMSRLLGLHPNIATHDQEFRMWPRFYRQYGDLGQSANLERCLAAMLSYNNIHALIDGDADYVRIKFREGEPTYGRLFALFFDYDAQRAGKARWGDQSQKLERHADAILAAYPAACVIHMIRDPRDRYTCKEIVRKRRGKKGLDLHRDTNIWLGSAFLAQRNQERYPDGYQVVRYETLVSQPKETLHQVCAFLGEVDIPAPRLTEGLQGFQDDSGYSRYDGVSTAYVGCFREAMPGHQVAFMQAQTQQAMVAYNYDLEPVRLSLRDSLMLYLIDWPIFLAVKGQEAVKSWLHSF